MQDVNDRTFKIKWVTFDGSSATLPEKDREILQVTVGNNEIIDAVIWTPTQRDINVAEDFLEIGDVWAYTRQNKSRIG